MKVSHKSIVQSNKNPIDGYVKKNLDLLDLVSPPTLFWDKNSSWNIIKNKIKSTDRKVVIWGMALAATVSMSIAAGIQFQLIPRIEDSKLKVIASLPTHHYSSTTEIVSKEIKNKKKSNNVIPVVDNLITTTVPALPETIDTKQKKQNILYDFNYNRYSLNKTINPYFTLGKGSGTLKPELGVDITLLNIKKNFKSKNIKFGLSTEFVSKKTEQKTKITPYHFANITFENTNTLNNKGWAIKTGILLNPDSNYYKGTTVKLVLSRKFNEWLKIGPELIFTNSMRNIYPAFSISLG